MVGHRPDDGGVSERAMRHAAADFFSPQIQSNKGRRF